jgi:hypothetical protein
MNDLKFRLALFTCILWFSLYSISQKLSKIIVLLEGLK